MLIMRKKPTTILTKLDVAQDGENALNDSVDSDNTDNVNSDNQQGNLQNP